MVDLDDVDTYDISYDYTIVHDALSLYLVSNDAGALIELLDDPEELDLASIDANMRDLFEPIYHLPNAHSRFGGSILLWAYYA